MAVVTRHLTLEALLREARSRVERVEPAVAWDAVECGGAVVVDVRSDDARERDGVVPGSLHMPRTVLEWRLAPDSAWRSPYAPRLDERLLLLCDHGLSSSLAAASLVDLGFERAGDVVGGFEAWLAARLPIAPAQPRRAGDLPGMGPPAPAASAGRG